jgi:hypothetical protein
MLEKLAATAHDLWSNWMRYIFKVGTINERGDLVIPSRYVERWTRQMNTEHSDLSEAEQASDVRQARKILTKIEPNLKRLCFCYDGSRRTCDNRQREDQPCDVFNCPLLEANDE